MFCTIFNPQELPLIKLLPFFEKGYKSDQLCFNIQINCEILFVLYFVTLYVQYD